MKNLTNEEAHDLLVAIMRVASAGAITNYETAGKALVSVASHHGETCQRCRAEREM